MNKYTVLMVLITVKVSFAQDLFFPKKNQDWGAFEKTATTFDEVQLNKAVQFALDNEYSGSRDLRRAILKGFEREPYHEILGPTKKRGGPAGMILKKGYLVKSWGDTKRVDMTFSVTKSFLSTVAGLAHDKKMIANINDKVDKYVWDGTFGGEHNSKITWAHLLQQNSDWSGTLFGIKDWADRPPRDGSLDDWKFRELQEPGTVMEYNDVRVNVLAYSLTQVWRKPLPMVLKEHIMDRIDASTTWRWFGYKNAWITIDGIQMKSVTGGGHSGGGLFISTEDMARFGILFLNEGNWNGTQLVSKDWIKMALTPSKPNNNYGYMWWLNENGNRHWEGIPNTVFYAAGFGGNFIVIDQERDLVVVTRWLEPNKIEEFMQAIYKAMD